MTHEREHVIIHKVREFLAKPTKRRNAAILCVLCFIAGAWIC
jgi:hypothetical protein